MGPPHNNNNLYASPLFCSLALVYSLFVPSQPVISQPNTVIKPNLATLSFEITNEDIIKKKHLALVHLINCILFQSFYKHIIISGNSFHIPSVLKAYCRVCRETNRKLNLLFKESLRSLHLCIYTNTRQFVPWRSTQRESF